MNNYRLYDLDDITRLAALLHTPTKVSRNGEKAHTSHAG